MEVLRHSGIRIEELLELTHLSVRQYQRSNGEVIALLVIAPSKTDRERVIPMSAELFAVIAVIAAIIRRHTADGRPIPLIQRYDQHERRMSQPMPFLFQRQLGTVRRVISPGTVLVMLRRRCAGLAEAHPDFRTASFTPHDFRRLLATELVNNGLPIHIGAALLGHLDLQTTRGLCRGIQRGPRPPLPGIPRPPPGAPARRVPPRDQHRMARVRGALRPAQSRTGRVRPALRDYVPA